MGSVANAVGMTVDGAVGNERGTGRLRQACAATATAPARQAESGLIDARRQASGGRQDAARLLRREWRTLGRFVLEAFGAGLVVSLVLALAVFIVTSPAMAAIAP